MKKNTNTRTVGVIGSNKTITLQGHDGIRRKKPIKGETKDKAKAPRFDTGTVIRDISLVTDCNGVSWWVDPDTRTIARVELPAA